MSEPEKMKCQICGCEITKETSYTLKGLILCEDCHMEETHPVITCDPKAVHSAKILNQAEKPTGQNSLDDLQKALYKRARYTQKKRISQI